MRMDHLLKRIALWGLCLLVLLGGAACSGKAVPSGKAYATPAPRKIIIDADAGADDAAAMILAAKIPTIEILGVTTLKGNVDLEQSTQNALAALEAAGCNAPVYPGADANLDGTEIQTRTVFGADGMGDQDLIHPRGTAQTQDAVDFILSAVAAHPGEVEIVSLGPATNLARAIQRDPETMRQVRRIWSMGTTGLGAGNATPVAEFNVYLDAPAYKVMLDAGIPITVIGLDQCKGAAMWTDAQFDQLSRTNELGRFVAASFTRLRAFYAANGSDVCVSNCDALAMMCAVYQDDFILETVQCHASCLTDAGEAYGAVVFYQEGFTYDVPTAEFAYSTRLVTRVEQQDYFPLYLRAISQ